MAWTTPSTNRLGITLVYRLPGPNMIRSASSMAWITSGSAWAPAGSSQIFWITRLFCFLARVMAVSPSTWEPSSNWARRWTLLVVTGSTWPVTAKKSFMRATAV